MMRKRLLLLLFWNAITCLLNVTLASTTDESIQQLYLLAAKNLNYGSPIPEDRILDQCTLLEKQLRDAKDYDNLFRVQLIAVNSNCLKGDLGFAVSKAQEMYDEARRLNSPIGKALAVQSIGITFMHSNESKQAYDTFAEAEELMNELDADDVKVRLLTQQMHVCATLRNMDELQRYLIEARKLLDRVEMPNKNDYLFYLHCYLVCYNIGIKDAELARLSLEQVEQLRPVDGVLNRWHYMLSSSYYAMLGDYDKALLYCDSTAQVTQKGGNLNEYKYILINKAKLFEEKGNEKEACELYEAANSLSDSLNMVGYSKQVDSLRVKYWVDQLEIENAILNNKMLGWIIFSSITALAIGIVLIYIALKKNKSLILSRKRLEEVRQETAASIQSKNLFLSNMSHELRTPLNAIVGFASLLTSEEIRDSETQQQCSELVKQNSELLIKLFNDVANLSALKEENIRFTFDHCDVVTLCSNVIDTVEKVKRTSAHLFFETTLAKQQLYTDSGRLQQVLINLLINATKFTPEGTITLKFDVDNERDEAVFAVEDTGCGIPLEKQPHIFERFEKLHENIQGAGLGLSICQLIVEHMGGRIWVDSSYTGGARFMFTHPLKK